jgi:hypothetical protein
VTFNPFAAGFRIESVDDLIQRLVGGVDGKLHIATSAGS